jgi:hypothetical protein
VEARRIETVQRWKTQQRDWKIHSQRVDLAWGNRPADSPDSPRPRGRHGLSAGPACRACWCAVCCFPRHPRQITCPRNHRRSPPPLAFQQGDGHNAPAGGSEQKQANKKGSVARTQEPVSHLAPRGGFLPRTGLTRRRRGVVQVDRGLARKVTSLASPGPRGPRPSVLRDTSFAFSFLRPAGAATVSFPWSV